MTGQPIKQTPMDTFSNTVKKHATLINLLLFFLSASLVFMDMMAINSMKQEIADQGFNCSKYFTQQTCGKPGMKLVCVPEKQEGIMSTIGRYNISDV